MESFRKMKANKEAADKQKRLAKKLETAKALLEEEIKKKAVSTPVPAKAEVESSDEEIVVKKSSKKKVPVKVEESDSSSEEEIVVRKSSKKKKQIIIESSDDESDAESIEKPKPFGKSLRNRKSNIRVTNDVSSKKNYFAD